MKGDIKFMAKLTVFFSILVLVAALPLLPASAMAENVVKVGNIIPL